MLSECFSPPILCASTINLQYPISDISRQLSLIVSDSSALSRALFFSLNVYAFVTETASVSFIKSRANSKHVDDLFSTVLHSAN